jgi:O-methyltransferase domain
VFKGGDFFVDALPKTDVIVMGHILHDWDLDQKKALLGKAFEALPKGGRSSPTIRLSTMTAAKIHSAFCPA